LSDMAMMCLGQEGRGECFDLLVVLPF
jgi:hypothetical protein